MITYFYNDTHKEIYERCIDQTGDNREWIRKDRERLGCFYMLALIAAVAPNHKPENYYDFKENHIISESINRGELTGTTGRMLRLAFILYNGFPDGEPNNGIPDIFGYNNDYTAFYLEALRIRYDIARLDDQEEEEADTV